MQEKGALKHLVPKLREALPKVDVSDDHLWYSIRGALNPELLIPNLAEALRIPAHDTEQILIQNGFKDLVAQKKLINSEELSMSKQMPYSLVNTKAQPPFENLFSVNFAHDRLKMENG